MKRQCPICDRKSRYFYRDVEMDRVFFRCGECRYIFVPEKQAVDEKSYFHEQWAQSAGIDEPNTKYADFILKVCRSWFDKPAVFDYGCGNGALVRYLRG